MQVERIMDVFYAVNATDGLFANRWFDNGTPLGAHSTVGATADSGYLLRQYLLMGDQRAQTQYLISMEGIVDSLQFVPPKRFCSTRPICCMAVATHRTNLSIYPVSSLGCSCSVRRLIPPLSLIPRRPSARAPSSTHSRSVHPPDGLPSLSPSPVFFFTAKGRFLTNTKALPLLWLSTT